MLCSCNQQTFYMSLELHSLCLALSYSLYIYEWHSIYKYLCFVIILEQIFTMVTNTWLIGLHANYWNYKPIFFDELYPWTALGMGFKFITKFITKFCRNYNHLGLQLHLKPQKSHKPDFWLQTFTVFTDNFRFSLNINKVKNLPKIMVDSNSC